LIHSTKHFIDQVDCITQTELIFYSVETIRGGRKNAGKNCLLKT